MTPAKITDPLCAQASVRVWAFRAGIIGLAMAALHLEPWIGNGILRNWIEIATLAGGLAGLGALVAHGRNRFAAHLSKRP